MKSTHLLVLFLLSAAATVAADLNRERPVLRIPLDDATKPAEVRIERALGAVVVRGTDDTTAVYVETSQPSPVERKDGLRVIGAGHGSATFRQHGNVVQIALGVDPGRPEDLVIRVPRTAAVAVSGARGGSIRIEDVAGDVEVQNLGGEIELTNLAGGALVETANGRIRATYTALPTNKALSFTSMNGEIELRMPADAKASMRFRTHNGNVLTDFEDEQFSTQVETLSPSAMQEMARAAGEAARAAGEAARAAAAAAREQFEKLQKELAERRAKGEPVPAQGEAAPKPPSPPKPPRPPAIPAISGGKVVTGTLNGGGTEIQIATMNGDIVLRRHAP